MNNPFENFDDWDEDIPENPTINLPFQQSNIGPRLQTNDSELRQIGSKLGRHIPTQTILNKCADHYAITMSNQDLRRQAIEEGDLDYADTLGRRVRKHKKYLKFWTDQLEARQRQKQTGVVELRINRS